MLGSPVRRQGKVPHWDSYRPLAITTSSMSKGCNLMLRRIVTLLSIACAYGPPPVQAGQVDECESKPAERVLPGVSELSEAPRVLQMPLGEAGDFTWWLPPNADAWILPISGGIQVDPLRPELMRFLREGSPWSLLELPMCGARYGDQSLVIIVPSPHHAELVFDEQVGIRFFVPPGRSANASCEVVALRGSADPLDVAKAFRSWRINADDRGDIPRRRPLTQKIAENEKVKRLLGAPHFYLWGPALFSKHDVPRTQWLAFARSLRDAHAGSFGDNLMKSLASDQQAAVRELAIAQWPLEYLTVAVAGAIDGALTRHDLLQLGSEISQSEVIARNQAALAEQFASFVAPRESWGDGLSNSLLDSLHDAGIDRAVLLLNDLYGRSLRPDVVARSEALGLLLGPYDSYHSVHSPNAGPNSTWETAQFDLAAYVGGRVINADGTGHAGFKKRGFHFSPQAAWPYMERRVGGIIGQSPYSAWFVDCDATAECFEDFSPDHPLTMRDDTRLRRQRLEWLETTHRLVVGSEGGSALFADVIHFAHGAQTPYLGHLDPSFRNPESPHFMGRHWPPDMPDQSFRPVTVPPVLKTPYFDPTVRIPLYQAAVGEEVLATHHWSFDSLKLSDVERSRQLMEILYMAPPMYHLNREAWPKRRERILRHFAFWSPLHRQLAGTQLVRFQVLTPDRLVQRTTFETPSGNVSLTVNFGDQAQADCPPFSASVSGPISVRDRAFEAN